jgi:hypothetical protein
MLLCLWLVKSAMLNACSTPEYTGVSLPEVYLAHRITILPSIAKMCGEPRYTKYLLSVSH